MRLLFIATTYYTYPMQPDRFPNDTSSEAEAILHELLKQAPAWRKFKMVGDLNAAVRLLAVEGIRARQPKATEEEVKRHLADLLLGKELAAKVYGEWEPADAA